MKRGMLIIVGILLIGFAVFGYVAGRKGVARSNEPYRFYYYPRLNAYYDFQDENFVYTLDGGKTWLTKEPASADLPEKLSEKVLIRGSVAQIWMNNRDHRSEYNGVAADFKKNKPAAEKITNASPPVPPSNAALQQPGAEDSYYYEDIVLVEDLPETAEVKLERKEVKLERVEIGQDFPKEIKEIDKYIGAGQKVKEATDQLREIITPSEVGAKGGDSAD